MTLRQRTLRFGPAQALSRKPAVIGSRMFTHA
jgi:hypothetical protein